MTGRRAPGHPGAALIAMAAGTLDPAAAASLRAHLDRCPRCRAELAEWEAIGFAARSLDPAGGGRPVPGAAERFRDAVRRRRALGFRPGRPAAARWFGLGWQLARAEARVVPGGVWLLSAAAVLAGLLLAAAGGRSDGGALLGLIVCGTGGLGVASASGAEAEPCRELALSLPVPRWAVCAVRLGMVCVFDALLGLAGSAALAAMHGGPGLWTASGLWLGPLLVLGGFSAALAAVWGSAVAASATLALWAVRLFGGARVAAQWHTTPPVLLAAAALFVLALVWQPRLPRAG